MSEDLAGKVAVITGAASGIGRSLAKHALDLGMSAVLLDRDTTRLERTANQFSVLHRGRVLAIELDLAKLASIQDACRKTLENFDRIDLLFNNAGLSATVKTAWEYTAEEYRSIFDANLITMTNCLSAFVPPMLQQQHLSRVINTASTAGYVPHAGLAAYTVTKHAIIGLSRALEADLRAMNAPVAVSVLCPSWVKTNIVTGTTSAGEAHYPREIVELVGKGMHPDDVARIAFEAIGRGEFEIFTEPDLQQQFGDRRRN